MYKNYLLTAWRNLIKNKTFSILNVTGLAIGIACFILIANYIVDEVSYDRWNKYADRLYRVDADIRIGGSELNLAVSSDPMGPTLKQDYPQVEEFVRLYASSGSKLIKKGSEYIEEGGVVHADSTLLRIFPFEVLAGDAQRPLHGPGKVILSETAARKYFGNTGLEEVIGKTLETDDRDKFYTVTAVIRDVPRNTHFDKDLFFSIDNVDYNWGSYLSNNFTTYIRLQEGADPLEFNKNFPGFLEKYVIPQVQQFAPIKSMDEFKAAGNKLEYFLFPVTKIHLYSNRVAELAANSNIQYVYIFSAVALFILLIACINFMNLSTARSANRAREVGVRKVLGTGRNNLISQFLTESTLIAFFATAAGIGMALLLLPFFNDLSAKTFGMKELFKPGWLAVYLSLPFLLGLIAGIYPAFYLSAFRPIAVLKGKMEGSLNKSGLRSALVVFQFATSILLIIGAIVVYNQLKYIQSKNIGFNKDQVLVIDGTGALRPNTEAFKNEISKLSGVTASTFAGYLPVSNSSRSDNTFFKDAVPDVNRGLNMQVWRIDEDYIPLMGMEILAGRNFSKERGTDSSAIILNEEAVRLLGFESNPLDQKIYGGSRIEQNQVEAFHVIGVVKDFNFESLRQKVGPLCFFLGKADGTTAFKVNTGNIQQLIGQIEDTWRTMAKGAPFSYRFLDQSFDEMYRAEQRVGKIALSFSILAIFIACLGLFGLATFIAEQRTKEIGIRKVLGAEVPDIITMLSRDFIRLVLIAAVVAFPLGWFLMNRWLQDFAFRINISGWVFVIAGLAALVIALFTISFQALKAALMNPVKSLRTE
ncbi:MAG TPA: ABC transporter permease [Saprospiraceae bacterium]|nr:ABC transporter permease [Saprospiraceae bacterium]HNT20459.1 ABC transporter permease [Saprospiraceae bacterium]